MTRLIALISMAHSLSGCGKQMQDFVDGALVRPTPVPGTYTSKPGVKVSSGHLRTIGTNLGVAVTVSPTQQELRGNNLGVRVGISRGPSESID